MRPLLELAQDGKEHTLSEARESLAAKFKLTEDDRKALLPSGRSARFNNRVAWARVCLGQAGALESPRRGSFRITDRGRELLKAVPGRITIRVLHRYPEFTEFRAPRQQKEEASHVPVVADEEGQTPEELLENSYQQFRNEIASEFLSRVKAASPQFFERLVVELLLGMGYGGSRKEAGEAIGKAGDEGIDGIISEDRLGLDIVYLQAKKWDGTVGRPEIQKFVGALQGKRAKKGVFISTGSFSAEAAAYVEHIDPKVVLIDGKRLAQLMIDFEVGVATARAYQVKRVDSDYFEEA